MTDPTGARGNAGPRTEASRTLRAAADVIRVSHGPGCADFDAWQVIAAWLGCVAIDEDYGEPETTPRIRERTTALSIARIALSEPVSCEPAGQQDVQEPPNHKLPMSTTCRRTISGTRCCTDGSALEPQPHTTGGTP